MTSQQLTTMTNPNELPDGDHPCYVAPTFELALAEYERKYGAAVRCWQYGRYFYFEGEE